MKRLLRRLYHAALATLLLPLGLATRVRARTRVNRRGAPERILVVRFGLLGDGTALLTPTLQRLRAAFPNAALHVLATPLQRPLLEGLPFVDRVLTWSAGDLLEPRQALQPGAWASALATLRDLRRERYDLAVSVYGRLASAVTLLSGARQRVGYRGEAFPATLTETLPGARYDRAGWHEAEYGVALADLAAHVPEQTGIGTLRGGTLRGGTLRGGTLRGGTLRGGTLRGGPLGGGRPDGPPMRLVVSAEGRRGLPALMAPGLSYPLVVIHPGATNGDAKRWPLPYWKTLVRRLAEAGGTVVLAGGPADRHLARAIVDGAPAPTGDTAPRLIDLTGKTTLPVLLALLERADVTISGDSGPLHLAIALERPTVAILGPTDPVASGPYRAPRTVLLRHDLPCSPCYRLDRIATCPLGHTLCQWLVSPDAVYGAILSLLADGTAQPALTGPSVHRRNSTARANVADATA